MVSEDATVKGDTCSSGESSGMTRRSGFGVEVHLVECRGDVMVGIAICDEAISLVYGDAILKVEEKIGRLL